MKRISRFIIISLIIFCSVKIFGNTNNNEFNKIYKEDMKIVIHYMEPDTKLHHAISSKALIEKYHTYRIEVKSYVLFDYLDSINRIIIYPVSPIEGAKHFDARINRLFQEI